MIHQFTQLVHARDLLWAWTGRTIRGRYQQSALGWLWAIIQPAASVAIFSVIFTSFVPIDTGGTPYPVFSYVAVVPWTFLATSLSDMSSSLVVNMNLVTKIYFPREILPLSAMLARLMDLGVAAALVVILMLIFQVSPSLPGLLFLPVILAIQAALILGLGLVAAAANVFFRDVQSLITLGIQVWFYASPIIYPITLVPDRFRSIYYLNPMAGILESYRDILLDGDIPGSYLIPSAIVSVLVLVAGYWFFRRIEYQFADVV